MAEKENFCRFCGILQDIGAKVLREVFFDKYVAISGNSTLAGYLAIYKQHLVSLVPNTLRKEQFDLLYPSSGGAPVIEDLDITLLCLLFRNLDTQTKPTDSIWNDPQNHQTYQADVTRIRLIRNKFFGHVNSASMSNMTYNNEVSNLTIIYQRLVQSLPVGRMSYTELQELIHRELNYPLPIGLDKEVKRLKEEMQERYRNDDDFKKEIKKAVYAVQDETRKKNQEMDERLQDVVKDVMEMQEGVLEKSRQWDSLSGESQQVAMDDMRRQINRSKEVLDKHRQHADAFLVQNQRYTAGKMILDRHGKILITGKAGQGKTYLAYQLLLECLKDKNNVRPLIISTADEWKKLADSSTELAIVVDDMCGKYGLLQGEIKKWNENARFITALIDNRKHTVIFTMRAHIYEETGQGLQLESELSDPLFCKNITLNLESDSMNLNEEDKVEFTIKYLKKLGLHEDEVLQVCRMNESSVGFPLLCRTAQSIDDKSKLFDFFTRPLEIMLRELEKLRMEKSIFYGCLVLAMLSGGTLKSESINEDSVTSDREEEIKMICGSYSGVDVKLADIHQAANTLCGTYLLFSKSDQSYSFVHNAVEEAVFLSYGKLRPEKTLKLCSLQSVCKLCRINNESPNSNAIAPALMLDLIPIHHGILIERFIRALEMKVPIDFANIAEANVWSSEPFRNLFMDKCKKIHVLADSEQNSLLVHAANANNCDLANELLLGMKKLCAKNRIQAISFLRRAATASSVHKDLCLFKQFMKTGDVNGNDILSLTVEKGSEEAVKFLLQNGADIKYRSKNGESLMHTACLHARLHMVKLLQSQYPLLVNQCDSRGRSVCHCAASGGSVEILKFLVQEGADPMHRDMNGMNLLSYACLEGKKEMAFHLMDTYSNMLYNVENGTNFVPLCAAFGKSIDIFKRVFKLKNVENLTDCSSQQEGLDPRSRTATQETLLHQSCLSGNIEITKYLVEKYPDMINEFDNCKRTPAHYAASGGNVSVLQYLIDKDFDPWCRTATQETLLHRSCLSGRLEITKYLVEKYPDMINEVDNYKRTAAHKAASGGNVSVLQCLIDKGLDPWCRTATQETLLHRSCLSGRLEITTFLVEKYPDMINELDNCKGTPAHHAADGGNISVLQYLIDKGLDPWCRTATQDTLLHRSCLSGRLEITKYLVEKYPDMINEVDNYKRTPAHHAASGGNVPVLQYLTHKDLDPWCRTATQETLLHRSCLSGRFEITKYLVEKYPDMINEVDNYKRTAAHKAASGGNVSVLQYLIDKGLDPWCRTAIQETLLHRSCLSGSIEITKYLVEKYPDMINVVNKCKGTPAHHAADGGNVSVLQYLIDKGLDPWCRTATQETLLHRSCLSGSMEITKYLVEKYPDMINEVDNCKGTPAHLAASGGNVSVLQYLIDKGLDPWCRTETQDTLLHRSCLSGRLEITKYLVEKYPDMINEVDNYKRTPAHHAASGGNVSVLQCLIDKGLDPWCRTATQETLLHRSCLAGRLEITMYLVEKYPDMINEVDNCKGTPAHHAADGCNVSVLQYLIDKGLDPWCRTATQETLLHRSCLSGSMEITKYLVEKYPDMINEVDNINGTPAHHAADGVNVSVLQYLINKGLDPWCRTATQETLLHRSCLSGSIEITKYLVEKYPDMINGIDNYKRTPAHQAASGGNVSVLQYLIDKGLDPWCRTATQENVLHRSCLSGRFEITKYLVEKYPDMINEVDNCNGTPAHHAASGGNVSVLQFLIDKGLDPWCRTATQDTLLHRSCLSGRLEITKYLVEKYPDMINEVDNYKRTPGHHAASGGNVSVLLYLIDKNLDPWCRTGTQGTLLHSSCISGSLEITKYLVEKYPDMINEVDNYKRTAAHKAASGGNVSVLQYLIDKGLDPWCRTATQETLLHRSCLSGSIEITKYLVEKYPDMINEVNNCKGTPAHHAADGGNVSVLQYLIDKGLDPWCRTGTQETLLHRSCLSGSMEITKYLVEKYPDMINEVDNCKGTPAHLAASGGNVSVLQYLIDKGLDPWCRTATQETLLHRSCLSGRLEITKYLVEKYPDMINEVDNYKRTPAHHAASGGNVSVLQCLIDKGLDPWCRTATQETLLHRSCLSGSIEITKYLVEKYSDMINEVDNCKGTPAHHSADGDNVSILQYLIDKGLDPWCRTATQDTLLHRSCLSGSIEITKYLVEKYPDMINEVDNCKGTPAHHAADGGNVSVLQYLIDKGLDPWCRTATQDTLLHRSCLSGRLEITKYLVEKYPDMINEVDNYKRTPAHHAASGGNVSILQCLIDKGLDPWCRTATQETLLHRSCLSGSIEITKYLVEKYPDMINEVDNCKGTPAHHAASGGNVYILQYLIDKGLDPWCRTATHETLLHRSYFSGSIEITQYLVEKYPDMINEVYNCKQNTSSLCCCWQ